DPDRADVCRQATPTTRARVREGFGIKTPTGQRPGSKDGSRTGRSAGRIGQEGRDGPPTLPRPRSGAAKSGWVVWANRRLNSSVEPTIVNVGGRPETDVPSSREEKPGRRRRCPRSRRPG